MNISHVRAGEYRKGPSEMPSAGSTRCFPGNSAGRDAAIRRPSSRHLASEHLARVPRSKSERQRSRVKTKRGPERGRDVEQQLWAFEESGETSDPRPATGQETT